MEKTFVAAGKGMPSTLEPSPSLAPDRLPIYFDVDSRKRVAHNVTIRVKNAELKISGNLEKGWAKFVEWYNKPALDHGLNKEQKRHYHHNLMRKNEARFNTTAVEPYAATFQVAVNITFAHYNSPLINAVFDYLKKLLGDEFVKTWLSKSTALTKTYSEIACMYPPLPSSHRRDDHQIRLVRHSVSNRA